MALPSLSSERLLALQFRSRTGDQVAQYSFKIEGRIRANNIEHALSKLMTLFPKTRWPGKSVSIEVRDEQNEILRKASR